MSDCPHEQGQHWLGDCGDLDAIPKADWIARANRQALATIDRIEMARAAYMPTDIWLRTLGAIQ